MADCTRLVACARTLRQPFLALVFVPAPSRIYGNLAFVPSNRPLAVVAGPGHR